MKPCFSDHQSPRNQQSICEMLKCRNLNENCLHTERVKITLTSGRIHRKVYKFTQKILQNELKNKNLKYERQMCA